MADQKLYPELASMFETYTSKLVDIIVKLKNSKDRLEARVKELESVD